MQKPPRTHPRIAVNLPVQISGLDISGRQIAAIGLIINMSRGGAALQLGFETAPNSDVRIEWTDMRGQHQTHTALKWKTRYFNQWRVGVEVKSDSRLWSDLMYFACQSKTH